MSSDNTLLASPTFRLRGAWIDCVLLAVLVIGALLVVFQRNQVTRETQVTSQLEAHIKKLRRSIEYVRQFREPFDQIKQSNAKIGHARVRWKEKLEQSIRPRQQSSLRFSIGDGEPIDTDLSGLSSEFTLMQFPVQVEASLENDASLLNLLESLHKHTSELFENRGCRILRQSQGQTLKLTCRYVIYDIEFETRSS